MKSGSYSYNNVDLSAGADEAAGMTLRRIFSYDDPDDGIRQGFGQFFTHNWDIQVRQSRTPAAGACYPSQYDYSVNVQFSSLGEGFQSRYQPISFKQTTFNPYAELNYSGIPQSNVTYTFVARDGTQVIFLPLTSSGNGCGNLFDRCAYASSVIRPDGTLFALEYDGSGSASRLRSVTSNRGYALLLEYVDSTKLISKACIINTIIVVKPANNICPTAQQSSTYGYSGSVQMSATMPDGGVWGFATNNNNYFSVTKPGESTPFVTNYFSTYKANADAEATLQIGSQNFAIGTGYNYTWNLVSNLSEDGNSTTQFAGGRWTDGNGKSVTVTYGQYTKQTMSTSTYPDPSIYITPGPVYIEDQLGRVTLSDYCYMTTTTGFCGYPQIPPLQAVTDPENNSERYLYTGGFRQVREIRKVAKPGSGFADIVEQKAYGSAGLTSRMKPTSITDPGGAVTDYEYDQVHGGVLTESKPADANGVRAVKRSAYVQRYAWISNGSGYMHAASPVWLLATEKTCRTTATSGDACVGGSADEVVTAYDYGPDTGSVGNNLLLRGVAVTADGQTRRTCYGYDPQGNRIWETKPRAGLASCY